MESGDGKRVGAVLIKAIVGVLTILSAQTFAQKGISIENAYVRPAGQGMTTAAYFNIVNKSHLPDTLYAVKAAFAGMSQVHETYTENSMTGMREIPFIVVPADSHFEFKPGGYHVMMMNVKGDLKSGKSVEFTLMFRHAGAVKVKAVVKK